MFQRKPISVASRIAWKLTLLFTFTLTLVQLFDIVPDPQQTEIRRKAVISETIAITSSLLLSRNHDEEMIRSNFAAIVSRYPEVLSARIRRANGSTLYQIGDHHEHWHLEHDAPSTRDNIYVPIFRGKYQWGTVELSFVNNRGPITWLWDHPFVLLGLFTVCLNGLIVRWYLLKAFQYLDPNKSVPQHVRATLDVFSEGVVVLDKEERIVLTNDKFKQHLHKTDNELLGQKINDLPWEEETEEIEGLKWNGVDSSSEGMRVGLKLDQELQTYLVNASAILDDNGQRRGTIASFDDITPLEKKREELSTMLSELQISRDELKDRNKELQYLATRDSLTGCLNRRSFFEIFDEHWKVAQRYEQPLSCFMVDLDHFKSVNDNHGHSVGDVVLQKVAKIILKSARDSDVVCRYGGEEFCVLLPQTDTDQACIAAEHMREAISQLEFKNLSVTASLGVSSIELGPADPQELLEQADKCLYAAKRAGRNQVARWDDVSDDVSDDVHADGIEECNNMGDLRPTDSDASIPYPAVASLLSVLAYRDAATAAHSTRVAELCVATAQGLLSLKHIYELEIAALLHDIGKVGVPDSILLKPGPLTPEEWETMHLHDHIGVAIVEASFSNQQLIDIVRYHHATYGGRSDAPYFPKGDAIPIGARIISIVDAYDAMVSDRPYRKGRSPERAFEELRRCAGSQFDPDLVERFIGIASDYQSISLPVPSKQTALQVGLQIERLAQAVDDQDTMGIKSLAARLQATAAHGGIGEIESVAADIKNSIDEDGDLLGLLQMVDQLMKLCRSVQKVYVETETAEPVEQAKS